MENYCTLYAHELAFDQIVEEVKNTFPKATVNTTVIGENKMINATIKGGFLKANKEFQITYRERASPSFEIKNIDSELTQNLSGMIGFVNTLDTQNEKVKSLLVHKISTLNCEFAILYNDKPLPEFADLTKRLAASLDAIVFARPETEISKSTTQHFLDKNLQLILDMNGQSEVDDLGVKINPEYFDSPQDELTEDQVSRKQKSEDTLNAHEVKVNTNLPCITSEADTTLRSTTEIAQRVTVLTVTNMVAFNNFEAPDALQYLEKFNLMQYVTPKEIDFLNDPTDEKKNYETWKCEGIWTLMWALNIIPDLGFPNELASLNNIPQEKYPIGPDRDPNDFIKNNEQTRNISEILDADDLYYRMNWACVDTRIKGEEMTAVHPGVVYERHYALNWLINYRNQDWDNVSTDT